MQLEITSDLNAKCLSSGLGNGLRWMTSFNMKVVDIFLGEGKNSYCPFIDGFTKKIDSVDPTVTGLNLAIKYEIPGWSIDHNIVLLVTCYLVPL